MIDWEEINGEDTDMNMSPARTLLYMKDGEKPVGQLSKYLEILFVDQNSGEITLSAAVPFREAFDVIDRGWDIISYPRTMYFLQFVNGQEQSM